MTRIDHGDHLVSAVLIQMKLPMQIAGLCAVYAPEATTYRHDQVMQRYNSVDVLPRTAVYAGNIVIYPDEEKQRGEKEKNKYYWTRKKNAS